MVMLTSDSSESESVHALTKCPECTRLTLEAVNPNGWNPVKFICQNPNCEETFDALFQSVGSAPSEDRYESNDDESDENNDEDSDWGGEYCSCGCGDRVY